MRRFAFAALALSLAVTVGGCTKQLDEFKSGFYRVEAALSSPVVGEVAPKAALAAVSTYDGLVVLATKWWRLDRCTGANGPLCRDMAYGDRVDAAIVSGRTARNSIKNFIKTHRGVSVPSGFYDAIVAANTTIDEATAAYRAALARN